MHVGTLNIGTATGKRPEISTILRERGLAVLGVQEHLIPHDQFPLAFSGYTSLHRFKGPGEGTRGVALLARQELSVVELGQSYYHENVIWAKITGLLPQTPCLVGTLYVPRMGLHDARAAVLQHLETTVRRLTTRSPETPIILMGDFNWNDVQVTRWIRRKGLPLELTALYGSRATYHAGTGIPQTAIDHILVNTPAQQALCPAKVHREVDLSDHWPVMSKLRAVGHTPVYRAPKRKLDVPSLGQERNAIVAHTLWDTLMELDPQGSAANFINTATQVLEDRQCWTTTTGTRERAYHTHTERTKTAIRRRQRLGTALREAPEDATLRAEYRAARDAARQLVRADARASWKRYVSRGAQYLLSHRTKAFWQWNKSLIGRGRSDRFVVQPVRDAQAQLHTSLEEILDLHQEHYAALATDPNPRTVEWWREHRPLRQWEELPDLNHAITWPELNAALRQLAPGKAPGMDGLPNEVYQLCRAAPTSQEPPTAMAKALLRCVNSLFDGDIPEDLNVSLTVSIPKPKKDATSLDNHRGISLISCLLKLVTRIVADRIQWSLEQHPQALRREQAGFRRKEECLGHVVSLYEACHRRWQVLNKGTYVAFIDLQKAFDTVPHNALLHILHSRGIRGKSFAFIEQLYNTGTFSVIAGGATCDQSSAYGRGVRQGDTLSPILFDLFIDGSLEGLTGVEVPGLEAPLPGLLFADDTALCAETPDDLQASLTRFAEWCDNWGMAIGHPKCGVMVIHDPARHEDAKRTRWIAQRAELPVVDDYTYLGVTVTPDLDLATAIRARAAVGSNTLGLLSPFLANTSIPIKAKILAIKSLLIPQLTYGGELWGLRQEATTRPLQSVLSKALALAVKGRRTTSVASLLIGLELGIPPIKAILDGKRVRAWTKWPSLHTPIAELCRHPGPPVRHGQRSWTRHTRSQLHRVRRKLGLLNLDGIPPQELAHRTVNAVWHHALAASPSVGLRLYRNRNLESSRQYIDVFVSYPELTRHSHWLLRARLDAVWTATRGARAGLLPEAHRDQCPACRRPVPDDLAHLLLDCGHYRTQRARWLGHVRLPPVDQGQRQVVVDAHLGSGIGGVYPGFLPVGQLEEGAPAQQDEPLCLSVARFLGAALPQHMSLTWTDILPRVNAPRVRQLYEGQPLQQPRDLPRGERRVF
jgi:exonuclease III